MTPAYRSEIEARLKAATAARAGLASLGASVEFDSHAPEDIAALLDHVGELEAENKRLRGEA